MIEFNYTLLIQFLNLLIVLILLNIFLFKPVLKVIGKREEALGSLLGKVGKGADDVKEMEKAYDEKAKERKRPILETRETTLSEAHGVSAKMIEQARAGLAEELTKVRADVDRESRETYDRLKGEVDRLSTEVAQKILGRSL